VDDDLTRLALIDPARGWEPGPEQLSRSRARIEEMMARTAAAAAPARVPRPRARRLVVGLAAAVTLGVGAIVAVPAIMPDSTTDTAYASWTPVPADVPAAQLSSLATGCAEAWGGSAGEPVLSERRGTSLFLIMRLRGGPLISCFSWAGSQPSGGDRLSGEHDAEPPLPPAGRVSMTGGPETSSTAVRRYSSGFGRVGPGVTGVDVVLPDGRPVQATVSKGWWAAWWPAPVSGADDALRVAVHTAAGVRSYRLEDLF
jgi:hypothetical protein